MVNRSFLLPAETTNYSTVKFLNFRTPDNFAVIYLKFKKRGQTFWYFIKKDANGIANSEDPDQTAPIGAVLEEQSDMGLHCLPGPICRKTLDHYSKTFQNGHLY